MFPQKMITRVEQNMANRENLHSDIMLHTPEQKGSMHIEVHQQFYYSPCVIAFSYWWKLKKAGPGLLYFLTRICAPDMWALSPTSLANKWSHMTFLLNIK